MGNLKKWQIDRLIQLRDEYGMSQSDYLDLVQLAERAQQDGYEKGDRDGYERGYDDGRYETED